MILSLRHSGESWESISRVLGVSISACQAHASRSSLLPGPVYGSPPPRSQPLPAGDSFTWGLLTDGTLLQGTRWPGTHWYDG